MKTKCLEVSVLALICSLEGKVLAQVPQELPCERSTRTNQVRPQSQDATVIPSLKGYLEDNFDDSTWIEGNTYGNWFVNYNGYGSVGIENYAASSGESKALYLKPKATTAVNKTHACLITSVPIIGDFNLYLRMKTIKQLRTPKPNEWETAWIVWHYRDDTHFYYFTLKTNGWELGKEDPDYPGAQRFLCTGSTPTVKIGSFDGIRVQQVGSTIIVTVNGRQIVNFTDKERPYLSGKLGLYSEDAYVHFDDISMTY